MDNKKLADYLHELVRFRNNEQVQKEEFNSFTEAEVSQYQDRTDAIYKLACECDSKDNIHQCSTQQLTLDEAIEHANDIADTEECEHCATEHKQLANWLTELKDIKNKYAYLAADFDNYKKRNIKSEQLAREKAEEDTTLHFLHVYDNLEMLLANLKNKDVGFSIIVNGLEKMLNEQGFKKIECSCGDKFDVNIMEAISVREITENENYKPDDVVEIYQSGWMHNEKMIRPVKVVVGK